MKKVLAAILALGMTTLLLASCGGDSTETTTTAESTTVNTTSSTGTTETTETSETETTTEERKTNSFTDSNVIDSALYDYYCQIMFNEDGEQTGVAVSGWKIEYAAANLVFEPTYLYRDIVGREVVYTISQVGTGQGVVNFQSKLESIEVKEGITKIGNKAFSMCTNLKEVILPEGLTSIGNMAFWMCTSLESVVIPATVTEIGNYAFSDCTSLKSVTISRAFESQVANIFEGCPDVVITYID